MKIIPFYCDDYDDLFANTYLLVDKSNNCLIIDPSKEYFGIINYINKNNLNIKGILLTHGHYDHFRGAKILINNFNCSLYIGFEEIDFLTDPYLNCSSMMSAPYKLDIRPITVSEGETLKILDEDIICIHTPFHTIGSYCYYLKESKILFTGDFIFKGSVGRSDLPTGSIKLFNSSINKINRLDNDIKIYPGHGPSTYLKEEKLHNPFIKNTI